MCKMQMPRQRGRGHASTAIVSWNCNRRHSAIGGPAGTCSHPPQRSWGSSPFSTRETALHGRASNQRGRGVAAAGRGGLGAAGCSTSLACRRQGCTKWSLMRMPVIHGSVWCRSELERRQSWVRVQQVVDCERRAARPLLQPSLATAAHQAVSRLLQLQLERGCRRPRRPGIQHVALQPAG
jgi:hypothetical protein